MKIFLFYNGDGVKIPSREEDAWWNYERADEMKLAWLCAASWRKNGWDVERITCPSDNSPWTGPLKESRYRYNAFLPTLLAKMDREDLRGAWVTTSDVINCGYAPWIFGAPQADLVIPNHAFTLAAFYATREAVERMCVILRDYDRGELAAVPMMIQHDEGVLRKYLAGYECQDTMTIPPNFGGPLVHVCRSSLQWFKDNLP